MIKNPPSGNYYISIPPPAGEEGTVSSLVLLHHLSDPLVDFINQANILVYLKVSCLKYCQYIHDSLVS